MAKKRRKQRKNTGTYVLNPVYGKLMQAIKNKTRWTSKATIEEALDRLAAAYGIEPVMQPINEEASNDAS